MNSDYLLAEAVRNNNLVKLTELHLTSRDTKALHTGQELLLRIASSKGYLDIVDYLVTNGARIHTYYLTNYGDMDSFILACYYNHPPIVKYFIENTSQSKNIASYKSGLMWAKKLNHTEVCVLLEKFFIINKT